MNSQGGKSLCRALGKSNVRKTCLLCSFEDVVYAVGNIVKGKLVDGKVPKLGRTRRFVNRLLRVLVAAVVPKLMIVS